MASIFGLPIPDGYSGGASFALSRIPFRDLSFDFRGDHAEIKAQKKRIHVFLSQAAAESTRDQFVERALSIAQDFLDHAAVQQQLSYRILAPEDAIVWQRTGDHYSFEINVTLPLTAGMTATPQLIFAGGGIQSKQTSQLLQAKAFRYYRFASSSEDLFEAYRYLYLCLESALHDVYPRRQRVTEKDWLKAALQEAIRRFSLNLKAFSTGGSDEVDGFYDAHYKAIRCATFHAKGTTLLPGNSADAKRVGTQIRMLQPILKDLLKAHFKAGMPGSGMTNYAMDMILKSLIPRLLLATTPREVNLAQEIQSALAATGYFEAFPKTPESLQPDTTGNLGQLIENARASFPFDLTEMTLDGKRKGYDDEWIVTAKTTGAALQYRSVRSIALCLLAEQSSLPDPFLILAAGGLTGKTVPTDFELPEDCNLEFKIRVLLRSFQEFPREFASN